MSRRQPRRLADFGPLTPAEAKLLAELDSGTYCLVGEGIPAEDPPEDVVIRASFLRWCILRGPEEEDPPIRVHEKGIHLFHAAILGDGPGAGDMRGLDLDACGIRGNVRLWKCLIPDRVWLNGASVGTLDLFGSHLRRGLQADGLRATGDVFLREAQVTGEVRLFQARIGGSLDCVGARFRNAGRNALVADGLRTGGGVFLRQVEVAGMTRLPGACIGGILDCGGGRFAVGGDDRRRSAGVALGLDGMSVAAGFFWREGASIDGVMDLTAATIGEIHDDPDCWPKPGGLILDRCVYGAFGEDAPVDAGQRLRWLALQVPRTREQDFRPQPYEQLARVLRAAGHEADARVVMIRKEHARRRARRAQGAALLRPVLWLIDRVLNVTVRHGLRPLLAFAWLAVFWSVGAMWFHLAHGSGALKPNTAFVLRAPEWVQCADGGDRRATQPSQYACFLDQPEAASYPRFNAAVYSADTLLPIVALEMQQFWIPDETTPFGAWARAWLWVQIAMGWALSLLAVAGFSGLIRSDSGK